MEEILPFLQKRFTNKTVSHNGYDYQFRKVEIDESLFLFTVNAITPVEDGGWVLDKMYTDIGEIVDNIFSYIGKSFTISIQLYVNGQDVSFSYIPRESILQVFEVANERYNKFNFKVSDDLLEITGFYTPLGNFKETVQFDDGVAFIAYVDVEKITINGEEKFPDLSDELKESTFVSWIYDHWDNVLFENAMYDVLEPSLQFRDDESLYYNAYIRINSYKGKKTKDVGVDTTTKEFLSLLEPSGD